jgi:hypothetical protein
MGEGYPGLVLEAIYDQMMEVHQEINEVFLRSSGSRIPEEGRASARPVF